ncbi:hypothetical protein CMO94_02270 [Candidatus Woesearchaeota archaeon]|jgi:hypothetical protein|nr:hypothetical protein [Candidatus Woesearchaeota archaeon]
MKKRGTLTAFSIIFLLILMPKAFSIYEELVYSGTVEDKDVVNITGSVFEFRIDSVSNKVFVEIDVSGVIIAGGECKIKDKFDICISNISFSYRNYTDWYDVYKTLVKVYQIKSTLDITNSIEKSNLLIDEKTTATLSFENTADIVAEDVIATIKIPSSVLVTEVDSCKKTFENIIFTNDVHPEQIKKCTYKMQGLTADDFELTADISYFDGIEQINTTSNTISGKVYNYSLKISPKLNKSKFNIREKLDLTVNIENVNDQYDLTITNFNIKIPEKLLLIKKPRDTYGNNRVISWSGTLAPNENKDFLLELQSLITSNYSVPIEASYKIGKFSRTEKKSPNIVVDCDCPYIQHDFSQGIAVPEQRVDLKAFVKNPSPVNDFSNVKINYITNIPNLQNFSVAYTKINPLETIKVFDSSVITPPLNEIYYFNITSIYESASNQVFIVKDNIILEIPHKEEIPIEKESEEQIEEEQQEAEEIEPEQIEDTEQGKDVALGTEQTAEEVESDEKEIIEEETPVTTLKSEEKTSIKASTIIVYIAALILILPILIILKRKKSKKENIGIKTESFKQEAGYENLEKQINELGNIFENKKQVEEKGFFGRIFKRK